MVINWIKELKKRGINEFQFKDLPDDLKTLGTVRKASALDKIKEKKKIKSIIVWKVE
jgi:hypothetical protein